MNCYWDCKLTSSEAAHKNPPTPRSQSIFPISTLAAPHPPPFSRKAFGAPASQWESPLGAIYGFPVAGQSLHSHGSSRQPLLLVRHVYSCIPAAAAVLFSQLPAPSPQPPPQRRGCNNSSFFSLFFSFVHKYIQGIIHISTQTVPLRIHSSLQAKSWQLRRQPRPRLYLQSGAPQPTCWTGDKGGRWVQEQGSRIAILPAPAWEQAGSSHAHFISSPSLEGTGDTHRAALHPHVLQPQWSPGS